MDAGALILVIAMILIGIVCTTVSKQKQIKQNNEYYENKLKEINLDDYYQQEEQELGSELNTIQNDVIFTKDYIKWNKDNDHIKILMAKDLSRAFHYVFSKVNNGLAQCKRYKFIVLEFKDGSFFPIEDLKNKKTLPKWYKHNEKFNFDDTIINLIKEKYHHVHIGYNTDNNDIRVYNTHRQSHDIRHGLFRPQETFNEVTNLEKELNEMDSYIQYCPKCGNQLKNNMNFCNKCGKKLDED